MSAAYSNQGYWEDRYRRDPEPFDWYQRYAGLKDLVGQYIRKSDAILMSGCGNSKMSEEMFDEGYGSITNIDYSSTVIEQQAQKCKDKKGLAWMTMDVTGLSFPDASFEAVLDKGTMDSVLCSDSSTANTNKMCSELSRVLKPGGTLIIISYGTPENRLSYLEKEEYRWRVTVHTIPKPSVAGGPVADASDPSSVHYIYVCQKIA